MYEKLISIDSEGNATINEKELKNLLQSEGDKRSTEASRTARENAERELREQIKRELEEEAKLNAEEKAQKFVEKERELIKKERLAINKEIVESKFIRAGIDKEDYESLLDYVSDNKDKSLEVAEKQISSITKIAEKQYQNKIKDNMGENSTPPANGENSRTPEATVKFVDSF
jgi:hypothetical protein